MNERQLIQRASRGDPRAERAIYDAHVDRVFRLAYRMTGDQELAEDLTQETFVRAFAKITDFRGDAALSTWLHTIATRTVLSGLRKVRRLHDHEVETEELPEPPQRPARDAELRLVLDAAIDALPEDMRVVFLMHDLEGFKHHEIGAGLGISPGTSKSRLHRARAWLREYLNRYGIQFAEEDAS
jgi:RNA polymerase sigma-70 factor (ECF subfamily)